MGNFIKKFFKNLKDYLGYIMKVGFIDLLIQFISLVILLVLSCFICVPIGLIQDVVISAVSMGSAVNDKIYNIIDLVFKIINFVSVMIGFMYLFNKKYDNVQKMKEELMQEEDKKKNMGSENKYDSSVKDIEEDMELPKENEDK